MDLDTFKQSVRLLPQEQANAIRQAYIERFVNTQTERYRDTIATLRQRSDGLLYAGYLWDNLKSKTLLSEEDLLEKLRSHRQPLFVFWDLHSKDHIFIKDYWKFPKEAVLSLDADTLLQGLSYLPEDIYIFDDSFQWSLIPTHEDIHGKRFCLETA